jgi:hypothetical protein
MLRARQKFVCFFENLVGLVARPHNSATSPGFWNLTKFREVRHGAGIPAAFVNDATILKKHGTF